MRNPPLLLILSLSLVTQVCFSDEYHYKNILIGETASGLGGAFSAISDDPSGVFYNPAGLMNAREGFFSAQANTITSNRQVFKNIKAGQDYTSRAGGLVAAYFGATQKIQGYRVGFNFVVPDSDLVDQNDEIKDISSVVGGTSRFLRKLSRQNTLYLGGPAIAFPFHDLQLGISLMGFMRVDRVVDTQFVTYNPEPTGKYLFQDTYLARNAYGIRPKLGILKKWSPELTSAFTVSYTLNLFGSGLLRRTQNKVDTNGVPVNPTGQLGDDITTTERDDIYWKEPEIFHLTLGHVYRFTDKFFISADIDYYSTNPSYAGFALNQTWNWSLGSEFYVAPRLPLRLAIYSNNTNTPELDPNKRNQVPHVNLIGGAMGASLLSENTSITLSVNYSYGKGEGQILTDSTTLQEVQQTSYGIYLSGSYQL